MKIILDKLIIFSSSIIYFNIKNDYNIILYFLISLLLSIILDLIENTRFHNFRILIYFLFSLICIYDYNFTIFLPSIIYNLYQDYGIYSLSYLFIYTFSPENFSAFLVILSIYLSYFTIKNKEICRKQLKEVDKIKEDYYKMQNLYEIYKFKERDKIEIAILSERNRISRELHNLIGHLISSSIIQLETISLVNKDENIEDNLFVLQDNLKNGMREIRNTIHDIHESSLNLENEIQKLFENQNMNLNLVYKIDEDLSQEMKFDILSIIKESLTNSLKHSNADKMDIRIIENPRFYSLNIKDNGNLPIYINNKGLGLTSIRDTLKKYKGILNINTENCFEIHSTFMKG